MAWYYIVLIVLACIACWLLLSALLYKQFFKRFYDIVLSGLALILLSPIMVVLIFLGAVFMRGNPFFVYPRAGRKGRVFNLIKFRSMSEQKDKEGNYLPDEVRLNKYGRVLRSTSLDELPELLNILIGNMSIVGPRPLTYKYLDFYTDEEKHRHDVRPGLTGLAQINGRNAISWEERFAYDLEYVKKVSFATDCKIVFKTVAKVLKREDVGEGNASIKSLHEIRQRIIEKDERKEK